MRPQYLLPSAAALLLAAAGAAPAQEAGATFGAVENLSEVDDDDRTVQPFELSADQVEDTNVANTAGEAIGEIEDVLEDQAGQIVAVAVELDDDIVDDGEGRVIGLDQLRLEEGQFTIDLSQAQLQAAPEWDD